MPLGKNFEQHGVTQPGSLEQLKCRLTDHHTNTASIDLMRLEPKS